MLNDFLKGTAGIVGTEIIPTLLQVNPGQAERVIQLLAQIFIAAVTIWSILRKPK